VGILNVDSYYDPLLEMLDRAVTEKFLFPEHRQALLCETDPERLLAAIENYRYPHEAAQRWMRQE
jgi:predicted Rossmann-fold nucleotide-binding protein